MKNLKRMIALVLMMSLLLTTIACGDKDDTKDKGGNTGNQGEERLSWLNPSNTLPLVKEGTEKTLKIYIKMEENQGDPEDTWFFKYVEEAMNINLEVTKFTASNRNEFLSMTFAGGELPDMIIGAGFTSAELTRYGAEGQLTDMSTYLNETYMPNLTAIYKEHPDYKKAVMDDEGNIWSFGFIKQATTPEMTMRASLNYAYLEKLGLKVPTTLDEFLDAMRAIKKAGLCEYPIGGSYVCYSPSDYILNALGYLYCGVSNNGQSICLRDGEVVLPIADREAYGEFLKVMKTCYDEGLIHPDYFTMDTDTTNNVFASNGNAFYLRAPEIFLETYDDWWGAMPLTSDYNDTPQWASNTPATCGGAVVTSECEEPELAATFIDWFFTYQNYYTSVAGPNAEEDKDYLYGFDGWVVDEAGTGADQLIMEKEPNTNLQDYLATVRMWNHMQLGMGVYDGTGYLEDSWGWLEDVKTKTVDEVMELASKRHDEENLPGQRVIWCSLASTQGQYITEDVFPAIVYFDEETTTSLTNALIAIRTYAKQETAKFVTGARALTDSELDKYFEQIEALGAKEYVQQYKEYYENMD